jgi:glycosyltransferase involved in cell wall biosynthesis
LQPSVKASGVSVRIVYLNPSGRLGGAETSLRELLASIRAAEPSWELWLVLGEDGPLAAIARDLGVKVLVKPFPRALARLGDTGRWAAVLGLLKAALATGRYAHGLGRWLRQIQPDIIHSNGFKMHLLGAWVRPRRSPLIWHIHDYVSPRPLMRRLLRPFRKACTLAVVNSNSVAEDLARVLPGLRTVPIYNAIDLRRFSPEGKALDLDALAGLPPPAPGTIRVGLIATFARWKGHKVFLEALSRLASEELPQNGVRRETAPDRLDGARRTLCASGAPVRGYIIGGPIYQTDGSQWSARELDQEVERLGLAGKVGFTGFLEDTSAALRSLDVVVHASTQPEPFGMVIIEGMACGRAVIASQAGGAAELFVDGENALAHAPGDVAGLARQIGRLSRDARLRVTLGQAGRSTAERFYPGQRLAGELLAVYREVGGNASGDSGGLPLVDGRAAAAAGAVRAAVVND